jgi:multidrug resistance protein, MATE family
MSLAGVPLLLWTDPWLALTRVDADVASGLAMYLAAIAVGMPAGLGSRAFVALNSAVSRPRAAMAIQLIALVLKVPANLVFMNGAGPIPALGGAGCGVATAALLWLMLLMNWALWRLDPFYARFRPARQLGPTWSRLRELLKLGLPSGGSILLEVSSFTLIALLLARFGAITVGGHQIVANMISILFMVPLSIGVAASVLVAQSLGAGDPRQAQRAALRGWRMAMALVAVFAAAMIAGRDLIVAAYTLDAEVAALAASLFVAGAVFHLFDGMQGVSGFILRGYKIALAPLVVHIVALWGVGLAGGYWLAFHRPGGWSATPAMSFWIAAALGLFLAGIALSWMLAREARRRVRDMP